MGGDGKVEASDPQTLKALLPETLGGFARRSFKAERNTAMGVQVSEADARYANDDDSQAIELEITDLGGMQALASLAGWAATESESETDAGYERSRREGDRVVSEKWNSADRSGEYKLLLGNRFTVSLRGSGVEIDALKSAAESVDLAALEKIAETEQAGKQE
jgi:hypothetical protein